MRRCAVVRGSNTWRGLYTSTRREAAPRKLQQAAPRTAGPERSDYGGIRQVPKHSDLERDRQVSGEVEGSPVKNQLSETAAECSPKNASKTKSESRPSQSFPLSPLMDPEVQQAKERYSRKKQPPNELTTQLQRELAKNPFALALATPIRSCGLNEVSLPRYFLQDFKILSHPTTDVPYFLPLSLTNKYRRTNATPRHKESVLGFTAYMLSNKESLSMMHDPHGGFFKGRGGMSQRVHHKLIPRLYLETKQIQQKLTSSRWRPDMEHFILKLLRRRCVERLVELANLKRGYLVGCTDWEDATRKPSVAAFLWTGGFEIDPRDPPPDFATLDLGIAGELEGGATKRKRKVLIYNLRTLLGVEKLAELREQLPSGIFTRNVVALKHKKMTVDLQMHLWKMQGYTAEFHKYVDVGRASGNEDEEDENKDDEDEINDDFSNKEDRGKSRVRHC